ncbi:MAG TPA: alpha/beta hydrolase [Luteolibacter sp.]|nr:alpha/beta hydrolase [Luteolibacter sp.]
MKKLLLLFCAVASVASAQDKPKWVLVKPDLPETVSLHENVECSHPGDFSVLVNVYVPKKEGPHPAILLIHGGGWQKRQIEPDKPLAERLASRGYVVTQVAYRLSTDAKYPAALHDCKAALRFMRANAGKYQIDPKRIGVMGGSAGGHLSALVGMTGGLKELEGDGGNPDQPTAIKACVVMAATMDLLEANKEKNSEGHVLFFGPIAENRPLYAQASPIEHVSKNSPPTLFIEGEKDTLKIGRAEMQEKLRTGGVPTELVTLKDAPHPFWMSQPWLDETAKAAGDWFDKYL